MQTNKKIMMLIVERCPSCDLSTLHATYINIPLQCGSTTIVFSGNLSVVDVFPSIMREFVFIFSGSASFSAFISIWFFLYAKKRTAIFSIVIS